MIKPKPALYTLPHGIEVIGEYPPSGANRYWRVRIRPHRFFPGVRVIGGGCDVRRNRVVMASVLGRALAQSEHVHHKDEDRNNDSPENLELITPADHNCHHKTGSRHSNESKAKTSASLKRAYDSGERIPVSLKGSQQGCAKFDESVAAIIKHSKESSSVLAKRYGVSKTTIKHIKNGKKWRHVA